MQVRTGASYRSAALCLATLLALAGTFLSASAEGPVVPAVMSPSEGAWVGGPIDSLAVEPYMDLSSSVAIDAAGVPHVAYHVPDPGWTHDWDGDPENWIDPVWDGEQDSVWYATIEGGTWVKQLVSYRAVNPSLALDSSGTPHIAFTIREPSAAYATLQNGNWLVESFASPAAAPSLAIDGDDAWHLAYYGVGPKHGLWYRQRNPDASWQPDVLVDPLEDVMCDAVSVALDSQGNPHIAYSIAPVGEPGAPSVRYAVWDATDWSIATPISSAMYPSLAVDSANQPHVAHGEWDADGGDTPHSAYSVHDGAGWQLTRPLAGDHRPTLVLDADDNPHIAISNYTDSTGLRYLTLSEGNWIEQRVAAAPSVGQSLALDGDGNPRITYYDMTADEFRHALVASHALYLPLGARSENP